MFPLQIDPLVLLVIGMVTVVGGILVGRWHAFLALLAGAFLVATLSPAEESASTQIAKGFGDTCRNVGIVIGLAAVIGRCLLESRAAERIVVALRRLLGEQRAAPALVVSGFILGIPVYFDTVFYLLLPIARTLARQTKRNYLLYVLSIIVGATMAHSLVPPTPGPLMVAGALEIDVALMMQAGIVVGVLAASSGYLFALWANRRWTIPLRDEVDRSDSPEARAGEVAPSLWLSLTPIVLPVVLLSLGTILAQAGRAEGLANWLTEHAQVAAFIKTLSDKHVALGLAAVVAMWMLHRYAPDPLDRTRVIQEAISGAGGIVLITAAGGAFGEVLRQCGIAAALQQRFPLAQSGPLLLAVAFFLTAVVRVAQGSATVAMITAVGILSPLVKQIELPFHPVYVALAIGCGSKPLPWMNDSGFWVITRMSGMTEGESLKTFSIALTVMGICGFLVTLAGASLLPLR